MAKLSDEEAAALKKLQEKQKAPDGPSVGKSINVSIDLSDDSQVARAIKHGFLSPEEVEEDKKKGDGDDDDDADTDEAPTRKGYFA